MTHEEGGEYSAETPHEAHRGSIRPIYKMTPILGPVAAALALFASPDTTSAACQAREAENAQIQAIIDEVDAEYFNVCPAEGHEHQYNHNQPERHQETHPYDHNPQGAHEHQHTHGQAAYTQEAEELEREYQQAAQAEQEAFRDLEQIIRESVNKVKEAIFGAANQAQPNYTQSHTTNNQSAQPRQEARREYSKLPQKHHKEKGGRTKQ